MIFTYLFDYVLNIFKCLYYWANLEGVLKYRYIYIEFIFFMDGGEKQDGKKPDIEMCSMR